MGRNQKNRENLDFVSKKKRELADYVETVDYITHEELREYGISRNIANKVIAEENRYRKLKGKPQLIVTTFSAIRNAEALEYNNEMNLEADVEKANARIEGQGEINPEIVNEGNEPSEAEPTFEKIGSDEDREEQISDEDREKYQRFEQVAEGIRRVSNDISKSWAVFDGMRDERKWIEGRINTRERRIEEERQLLEEERATLASYEQDIYEAEFALLVLYEELNGLNAEKKKLGEKEKDINDPFIYLLSP